LGPASIPASRVACNDEKEASFHPIPLLLILSAVTSSALLFWQEISVANRNIQQAGINDFIPR